MTSLWTVFVALISCYSPIEQAGLNETLANKCYAYERRTFEAFTDDHTTVVAGGKVDREDMK